MASLSDRSTLSPGPFVDRDCSITLDSSPFISRPIREIPRLQFSSPSTQRHSPTPSLLVHENLSDGFSPVAMQNDSPLKARRVLTQSPGRENVPIRGAKRRKLENSDSDMVIMDSESELRVETGKTGTKVKGQASKKAEREPRKTRTGVGLANGKLKGKITKPSAQSASAAYKASAKPPESKPEDDCDTAGCGTEELQLKDAVKRRPNWTPIKDTAVPSVDLTGSFGDTPLGGSGERRKAFGTFLSDYGFCESTTEKESDYIPNNNGPTAKQRVQVRFAIGPMMWSGRFLLTLSSYYHLPEGEPNRRSLIEAAPQVLVHSIATFQRSQPGNLVN